MWLLAAALAIVLLAYDYIYPRQIYDWRAKRAGCGPVAKQLSWPFGMLATLKFAKLSRQGQILDQFKPPHSQTTHLTQINTHLLIYTADPENVKALLSTQFSEFDLGLRHRILSPLLGNGIFTVHGQEWKHQRTLLRPIFSRDRVSKLEMLDKHTQSLLRHLGSGQLLDIQAIFFEFTLDTSLHFLFDIEHDSFEGGETLVSTKQGPVPTSELVAALGRITKFLMVRKLLARIAHFAFTPQFRADLRLVHSFADAIVDSVLADSSGDSFISQAAEYNSDRTFLRDQAFTMFVAGRSTTASFLTHAILELSQDPVRWTKLRQSVLSDLGPDVKGITFESLKRSSYLSACLNETLRLHPNVALNMRSASKDTTLPRGGGSDGSQSVFVPKGMMVQYNSYGLHRDPRYWGEDAEAFKPERWIGTKQEPWTYIPFNGGPRTCLGQQFALNEAGFVLARLAQEYSQLRPGPLIQEQKHKFSLSITIRVEPGVDVEFVR